MDVTDAFEKITKALDNLKTNMQVVYLLILKMHLLQ